MLKTIWHGSIAVSLASWTFGPSERILTYSRDGFTGEEFLFIAIALGVFALYLIGVFFPFLRGFKD